MALSMLDSLTLVRKSSVLQAELCSQPLGGTATAVRMWNLKSITQVISRAFDLI